MTFNVTQNNSHTAEAKALLVEQYKGKPKIEALLASWVDELQEVEDVLFDLFDAFLLDNAVGDQLDFIGKMVGELRKNRSDADYRLFIKARIAINRSNGKPEEILSILRIVSDADARYFLREYQIASLRLRIEDAVESVAFANMIHSMASQAKSAAVSLQTQWSLQTLANRFTLSSTNALETSSTQGLANASQTTGGHLDGVMR